MKNKINRDSAGQELPRAPVPSLEQLLPGDASHVLPPNRLILLLGGRDRRRWAELRRDQHLQAQTLSCGHDESCAAR